MAKERCDYCGGRGRVECDCTGGGGREYARQSCPMCYGSGFHECPACNGSGYQDDDD